MDWESVLELRVELSSEESARGRWPVHLALGANVVLADGLELIPELSWIRHGDGDGTWGVSLGVVIDPSRLRH